MSLNICAGSFSRFRSGPVFRRVSEQTSERDDGREASEVDEEVGGDALHRDRVGEVGQVERRLPLDVVDQTWAMLEWTFGSSFQGLYFCNGNVNVSDSDFRLG